MTSAEDDEAEGSEGGEDLDDGADSNGGCPRPPVVSGDDEGGEGEEGGKSAKGESKKRSCVVVEGVTRQGV